MGLIFVELFGRKTEVCIIIDNVFYGSEFNL